MSMAWTISSRILSLLCSRHSSHTVGLDLPGDWFVFSRRSPLLSSSHPPRALCPTPHGRAQSAGSSPTPRAEAARCPAWGPAPHGHCSSLRVGWLVRELGSVPTPPLLTMWTPTMIYHLHFLICKLGVNHYFRRGFEDFEKVNTLKKKKNRILSVT